MMLQPCEPHGGKPFAVLLLRLSVCLASVALLRTPTTDDANDADDPTADVLIR